MGQYLIAVALLLLSVPLWYAVCLAGKIYAEKESQNAAELQRSELLLQQTRQVYLREMVYDGVAFAEEEAFKAKKATGEALEGGVKTDLAIEYVLENAPNFTDRREIYQVVVSTMAKIPYMGASGRTKV
jgi:hypothetical protein